MLTAQLRPTITLALALCASCSTTTTNTRSDKPAPRKSVRGGESAGGESPGGAAADPGDCLRHLKQAHALVRSGGDHAKTLAGLQQLTATIRDLRRQELEGEEFADCERKAAKTLRGAAGSWYKAAAAAQQPPGRGLLEKIAQVYHLYTETFPSGEAAYKFSFFRAQVLFKLERWAAAATAYDRVAKMAPPKGETDRRIEAGLGAVVAWKKAFAAASKQADAGWAPAGKRLVAAIDAFLLLAPNTPERVSLRYEQARAHYRCRRHDAAVRIFAEIVTRSPRHEHASAAARLLLDSLNAQRKHDELRVWVDRLLAIKPLARGDLLAQLNKLKLALGRLAAEKLAREQKFRACGEAYERLVLAFPGDPRWGDLAYNGAVCFEHAKLADRALALHKRLVQRAPTSPLARRVLQHICARPEGRRVRWWRRRCK